MNKVPILIVLAFWEGDKAAATDVCRIMAGLQSSHAGNLAHVMLVNRQDCKMDMNMIKIVAPKFNVHTYHSSSMLRGWPAGSNGLFGSTMIYISTTMADKYECIYWLEPDAVPIRPNWFWDLVQAWRGRPPNALVVGCRADCNGNGTGDHITGCAIYDPNIARLMPQLTTCQNVAWDYQHRDKIVRAGHGVRLIQNRYRQNNVPSGVIDEPGVVIIHGVKDRSVIRAVANKFKISLF